MMLALPALLPLLITGINLVTWRPVRTAGPVPRASALVPARDEEATIEACVRALLAEPFAEVIVLDDHSTDRTAAILAGIDDPRLRVLRGSSLPPGAIGKPHACAQLGAAATGELLVFVDADVRFQPGGLARLCRDRDVVTALPAQETGSLLEGLIIAQLLLTYASWLPLALIPIVRDPRILAANGQVLAVRADAYRRIGGFEAVRAEVVDDMALCRRAKEQGLTVEFVDGSAVASCRMYRSGRAAIDGFTKNLYEGIGGKPASLLGILALHVLCFVLPWATPWGAAINLAQRTILAVRHRLPWWTVPLHPVGIVLLLGVAIRSWWRNDRISWRGRTYAARDRRVA